MGSSELDSELEELFCFTIHIWILIIIFYRDMITNLDYGNSRVMQFGLVDESTPVARRTDLNSKLK